MPRVGFWKRMERYRNTMLAVAVSAGVVTAVLIPGWRWLVWDACAKPQVERALDEREAPIVKALREIHEALEYANFVRSQTIDAELMRQINEMYIADKVARRRSQ